MPSKIELCNTGDVAAGTALKVELEKEGLTLAVFVGAIVAMIYGFLRGNLIHEFVWLPWGRRRLVHFVALFGAPVAIEEADGYRYAHPL